ncbi:hypothetical protein [Streptomyces pseudogriseolus]|uniref:hypothetical protein n=1 Tax=Streptomyces pseudogriseolus TaxID=36817 RepID=UPI003FA1EB3B
MSLSRSGHLDSQPLGEPADPFLAARDDGGHFQADLELVDLPPGRAVDGQGDDLDPADSSRCETTSASLTTHVSTGICWAAQRPMPMTSARGRVPPIGPTRCRV